MKKIDEPLDLSAPLAWQLAPQLCRTNAATGGDCAWNHGLWQYLRLMGLGGSPAINAHFYWRAFATVTGNAGPPRILISGAADYSMLAHVLAAFGERGIQPAVTVVDICATPLALNRWYAERLLREISVHCGDVCDFTAADPFDAICTHSFFGQIPPAWRPRLAAAWQRLLRPGGLAICVDRIRPVSDDAPVGFTPSQAQAFCTTVASQAQARRESLAIDPIELARAAEIYASRLALYPVRSGAEIRGLFERAGFEFEQLACGPNEVETAPADSGPAIPARADYASIIARRL